MEKTFNKIVLSQTEPNIEDLWMRVNSDKGQELGHSLWWFSSSGWKKLFDFDTRYNVTTNYKYQAAETPYESVSSYNPEVGIVTVTNEYNLYDGSRNMAASSNLVLEKGLKKHVDSLLSQITTLRKDLDSEISTRQREDTTLSNKIDGLLDLLNSLSAAVDELQSKVDYLESRL